MLFGTLSLSPKAGGACLPVGPALPPRSLSPPHPHAQVWCRCITTIFNYFVVTNFFWMFVEGCYLHTAIVMTYSTEHLRKWLFLFTGWCEGPRVGGRASWERGTAGKTPLLVLRLRAGAQPAQLPPCSPCRRPMLSRPMPQDSSARHPCAISGCICFLPSARPPKPSKGHSRKPSSYPRWPDQRSLCLASKDKGVGSTCPPQHPLCLERMAESWGRGRDRHHSVADGLWLEDRTHSPSPLVTSCLDTKGGLSASVHPVQHVSLLSGIPCPIIVAWAVGKLYYENEQ